VTKVSNLDVLLAYNVPLHLLSKVKEVKVGVSDESNYEITSGLNMGESIISVVDETLKDGQKIKIADPKKPKKDNKKIIKSQDVESVPAGEAAPGGPGPM